MLLVFTESTQFHGGNGHLPIYRQQDFFAGSGWTPARSTLLNLLVASAPVIRPLAEHFERAADYDSLRPDSWKEAHPEAVRT